MIQNSRIVVFFKFGLLKTHWQNTLLDYDYVLLPVLKNVYGMNIH